MTSESSSPKALIEFAAGTLAGVSQIIVGHPFDTVKVNLQVSRTLAGPLDVLRQIVTQQGVAGLYRGLAPPLVTVAAYNSLLFSSFGALHRLLRPEGGPLTPLDAALTGGLTGVPVSLLVTPTELLKCRLQRQGGARPLAGAVWTQADAVAGRVLYKGALDAARQIVRFEGGPPALWRGLMPTLAREVPGNAFYFGVYTWMKVRLAERQGLSSTAHLGPGSLMLAGGVAGAAFWLPTIPADVVKSRIQTDNPLNLARGYSGMVSCARAMVRKEGFGALFRGWQPCLARSVPANAATFLVYELAYAALTKAASLAEA